MTQTTAVPGAAGMPDLPLPPVVDFSLWKRIRCVKQFHTGAVLVRDRFGPVAMLRLGAGRLVPTVVFVSSVGGAHDVLANRDGAFDKTGRVHHESRKGFGEDLFTMPHAAWTPRRRTVQPVFTRQHVEQYGGHMATVAHEIAEDWFSGGKVDLDAAMRRLTLNVLGRALFGHSLGDEASARLAAAMPPVLKYVTARSTSPMPPPRKWPTLRKWRWQRGLAQIHAVIDEAIADCAADRENSPAELIRLLLEARDPETGIGLSHDEIRDELLIFLIAGHDTTATTLTYALWELGRDQELQDRVAAEVAALGHDVVAPGDIHHLGLTTRVIEESMRLCPAAPALSRHVEHDAVIDGYRVPKDAEVIVSMYALHRDPAAFPDPQRFDPDRFLPERSTGRDRWQFLPFGGGPRKCVGANFAMAEAVIGLATLVGRMRVESLDPTFKTALPFTMTAAGAVPARVSPRRRSGREPS